MHTHTPFQWLFFQVKLSHPLITFLSIYSEIKIELRLKLCFMISHVRRFDPIPERFHFRTFR